jgi:hypothetical protein
LAKQEHFAKAHSRLVADEYLRLGWRLATEFRAQEDDEPYEYLFVWSGPGAPIWPDRSQLQTGGRPAAGGLPDG